MRTRGNKGQPPELLGWVQAARYLNMPTPDLIEREDGRWYRDAALRMLANETDAQEREQKRRKPPGRG